MHSFLGEQEAKETRKQATRNARDQADGFFFGALPSTHGPSYTNRVSGLVDGCTRILASRRPSPYRLLQRIRSTIKKTERVLGSFEGEVPDHLRLRYQEDQFPLSRKFDVKRMRAGEDDVSGGRRPGSGGGGPGGDAGYGGDGGDGGPGGGGASPGQGQGREGRGGDDAGAGAGANGFTAGRSDPKQRARSGETLADGGSKERSSRGGGRDEETGSTPKDFFAQPNWQNQPLSTIEAAVEEHLEKGGTLANLPKGVMKLMKGRKEGELERATSPDPFTWEVDMEKRGAKRGSGFHGGKRRKRRRIAVI